MTDVTSNPDLPPPEGRRLEDGTFEWTVPGTSEPFVIRHDAPDALRHLYGPGELNELIPLYQGKLRLADDSGVAHLIDGQVAATWKPRPRIQAWGSRPATAVDLLRMTQYQERPTLWVDSSALTLEPVRPTPPAPPSPFVELPPKPGSSARIREPHLAPTDVGSPHDLDAVTGLLPNGIAALDAYRIADGADPRSTWHGRITMPLGAIWVLTIDEIRAGSREFYRTLCDDAGYAITHVAEFRRTDGTRFSFADLEELWDLPWNALTFAYGRRTGFGLPVGWRDGRPVWARWSLPIVDEYLKQPTWFDESIGQEQLIEIFGCLATLWPNDAQRDTIHYAIQYYRQALDMDFELAHAALVSGLSLLGESWLVGGEKALSRSAWDSLDTTGQIAALLAYCGIDTSIPPHFRELVLVHQTILTAEKTSLDGLGCLVRLRNHVTHPTTGRRRKWTPYQWAESRILGLNFLELAILRAIGYQGKYRSRLGLNRWSGVVENVPWK